MENKYYTYFIDQNRILQNMSNIIRIIAVTATIILLSSVFPSVYASAVVNADEETNHQFQRAALFLGSLVQDRKFPIDRVGEIYVSDTLEFGKGAKPIEINREPYFICVATIPNMSISMPQDIARDFFLTLKKLGKGITPAELAIEWVLYNFLEDIHAEKSFSGMFVNHKLSKVVYLYTDGERPQCSRLSPDNFEKLSKVLN
jgi:hypothetical protein